MQLKLSAFQSDHLHITRWELIKLFLGITLRVSSLVVKAGTPPKDKSLEKAVAIMGALQRERVAEMRQHLADRDADE